MKKKEKTNQPIQETNLMKFLLVILVVASFSVVFVSTFRLMSAINQIVSSFHNIDLAYNANLIVNDYNVQQFRYENGSIVIIDARNLRDTGLDEKTTLLTEAYREAWRDMFKGITNLLVNLSWFLLYLLILVGSSVKLGVVMGKGD